MRVSGQWLFEEEESPPLKAEEDLDFDLELRFGRSKSKMDLGPREDDEEEEDEEEVAVEVEVEEKIERRLIVVVPVGVAVQLDAYCNASQDHSQTQCKRCSESRSNAVQALGEKSILHDKHEHFSNNFWW